VACALRVGGPERHWSKAGTNSDVFAVKADMLAALEAVTGAPMTAPVNDKAPGWYHPGRSGSIALGPKVIARFGEIHPRVLAAYDLKGPAAAFEIFLDEIPAAKAKGKAKPLFAPSPFQAIDRDFAFVVAANVPAGDIVKAARLADRNLIEAVGVFDVYEGTGVPEGHKSVAIAVRIQPRDKTLTESEIDTLAQKIVAGVTRTTGAMLRS
jgi:phenylalanyl-tRNA synthetase beta chain